MRVVKGAAASGVSLDLLALAAGASTSARVPSLVLPGDGNACLRDATIALDSSGAAR